VADWTASHATVAVRQGYAHRRVGTHSEAEPCAWSRDLGHGCQAHRCGSSVYSTANSHQMMLLWASYDAWPESAIPPHLSGKSGDVAATNAQRCYSRWHHENVRQPFGHDVKRTRCRWPLCKDLLEKVLRRHLLAWSNMPPPPHAGAPGRSDFDVQRPHRPARIFHLLHSHCCRFSAEPPPSSGTQPMSTPRRPRGGVGGYGLKAHWRPAK